ncbi:hypothetical protein HPB47_012501, partial [Ixodes persulcatus]
RKPELPRIDCQDARCKGDVEASVTLSTAKNPATHQQSDDSKIFLCVTSLRLSYSAQIPRNVCTHLIYRDVQFSLESDTFTPINGATLSAVEDLSKTTNVLVAVAMPSLAKLTQSPLLVSRFAESAVRWLLPRKFLGIAFLSQRFSSQELETLSSTLQVCQEEHWMPTLPPSGDAEAAIVGENKDIESHEDASKAAAKIRRALKRNSAACVAAFDVDLDDYEGVCAAPFFRLRMLRNAQ